MSDQNDFEDDLRFEGDHRPLDDAGFSPICSSCGVSCLPPETPGGESCCENPDCDAFGEAVA